VQPVAEEPRLGLRQAHQCRLQQAQLLADGRQQPFVMRQVLQHQAHHLLAQQAADVLAADHRQLRRRGGFCVRRGGRLRALAQALHQWLDQVQVFERRHRRRHGVQIGRTAVGRGKVAGQQLAQAAEGQQRAAHGVGG